jgi:hypothetical protein
MALFAEFPEIAVGHAVRKSWGDAVVDNVTDIEERLLEVENQVGVVSGDAAAPLFIATVSLTNAQIKALPTTAVEIIAAPSANSRVKLLHVTYAFWFEHGAYTNVDTTSAELYLKTSAGTILGGYLANDNGVSLTTLTTLFGAVSRTVDVPPMLSNTAGTYLVPVITGTPINGDGKAVQLFATNNGAGDFTGGHDSNRLTVQAYYSIQEMPAYRMPFRNDYVGPQRTVRRARVPAFQRSSQVP